MAGHKSPKIKDDKAKKRKREANDGETKSKRHRQQRQHANDAGHERRSVPALEPNKSLQTDSAQDAVAQDSVRWSDDGEAGWRISKPMGGRMLDIDPILTTDEKHLILTYNTSIQVYNATDSLLIRRIPICALDASAPQGSTPTSIVAVRPSKQSPDLAWVACSDGQVCSVNWTVGSEVASAFRTISGTAKAMTIVSTAGQDEKRDIILIAESDRNHRMEVVAYQGKVGSTFKSKKILVLKNPGEGLHLLEASEDGQVLVGAFHDRLFLGAMSQPAVSELDQFQYEIFSFDTPDLITTLDLRRYARPFSNHGSNRRREAAPGIVVDIIAGGARGGIYVYRDALSRVQAAGKPQYVKDGIQVHKFHWHRKAVHSVKWSRDGNYFISGGSENVLVIWQVDTSKQDFLPHLSGSVENIVVSASGSYILHLDDNSALIISTAELKPTAFVSGIQSATINVATPKDALVKRLWNVAEHVRRPVPAAIRPSDTSKIHVCVGNGRQATMTGDFSAPLLQTFDLESFTGVSKQALARTHPTDVNLNNGGHAIDEPLVSHIAFSNDGKWLASVDEWKPSTRDVELVSSDLQKQFIRERHEIYLKFWQVREDDGSMALVSRINGPHCMSHPEAVLDLASDPTATCFASIGGDGIVRLWRPKSRRQNGVAVKSELGQDAIYWSCSQLIAVGKHSGQEPATGVSHVAATYKAQGSLAFSEDGSTLFAAFGIVDAGVVYIIDTASGQVVKVLDGLWQGQLHAVGALSSFVVVLSDELRVYDVISDELRYGIVVPKIPGVHELLQLAVDCHSGCFAVALPIGDFSSVGVFDPGDAEPLLVRSIPHRIVTLISAPAKSGFIVLDDTAQTWVVAEGSDPAALATMQPLQDLRLDDAGAATKGESKKMVLAMDDAEMTSDDEMGDDLVERDEDVDMDEDSSHAVVVPHQYLAAIFDATPAFAAPSVEEMFYRVADLLAAKPVPVASA